MVALYVAMVGFLLYSLASIYAARAHARMMRTFDIRIHVNGIRGKSSVTRLIASVLREGGIKTVGKTTGTAARMFVSHKMDWPIERKEANISEQRTVLRKYSDSNYKAVVFECMAVNPIYQKYLEEKIMHSTIGIITNVREDHVEKLGKTIPDIARSLSSSIPRNGILITAETNPGALEVLGVECAKRNCQLRTVTGRKLSPRLLKGFKHHEYLDNVAIALEVAKCSGIKRSVALRGMYTALPDPGAFRLRTFDVSTPKKQRVIHWANLFAINDRESFETTLKMLRMQVGPRVKRAVILNNRHDRPERVAQFVDIVLNSVKVDYIITFGDYEKQVNRLVKKSPKKNKPKVIHLGNSSEYRSLSGELLWEQIVSNIRSKECLLVGAVNIHTTQSQNLLEALSLAVEDVSYAH